MKIIIADDQKLLRDCLKHMIQSNSDIEVIGCAENGLQAYELCKQNKPDLVLMDIKMPVCDGIEASKLIKKFNSKIKVLMLTVSQSNEDVEVAMNSGADGYVLKDIGSKELILAIKSVYSGLNIIQKEVYQVPQKTIELKEEAGSERIIKVNDFNVSLSERDIKIIQSIVEGKELSIIAKEIYLTEGRVRNIVTEIINKLSLKDRAQLVAFAYKNNLV